MTAEEFEAATGIPLDAMAGQCHAASIALVKSGVLGPCRVARGTCSGVGAQHSWVVLGMDCYAPNARIVDPTLWSYDSTVGGIWTGRARERPHTPHGDGSIYAWGKPGSHGGEPIELDVEWSRDAQSFLDMLGPLDYEGWAELAHAPVCGWPAGEIIGAMYDDKRLRALIPIDIVGMITDRNPSGLYLREGANGDG